MTSQAYQPFFFDRRLSELPEDDGVDAAAIKRSARFRAEISRLFEILTPKPSPSRLIRIGGNQDGAYLVPDDLSDLEACFSPGVNNIKFFEDELCLRHAIKCHMCDYSSCESNLKTPLIVGHQTFRKKWLSAFAAADSITLKDWVGECCCSSSSDLILQMDIEGAEYSILIGLDEALLSRFRILVIEFHHLHRALYDHRILRDVCLPVFESLDRMFTCVHAHANNYQPYGHPIPNHAACMPEFIELTFLRKDRFNTSSSGVSHPVLIPHPLDITNVPANPPMFLEAEWGSGRSWPSSLKIARDRLSFLLRNSLSINSK